MIRYRKHTLEGRGPDYRLSAAVEDGGLLHTESHLQSPWFACSGRSPQPPGHLHTVMHSHSQLPAQRGHPREGEPHCSFFPLCCYFCNFPDTVTHCFLLYLVSQSLQRWPNQNSAWDAELLVAFALSFIGCLDSSKNSIGSFTLYLAWTKKRPVHFSDSSVHWKCSMVGKGVKKALTLPCYVSSNCKITLIANVKQSNFRSWLLFCLHRLATTLEMQNCQVYLRAGIWER